MIHGDFRGYKNPAEAWKVLTEYEAELDSRGLGNAVQSAIVDSKTPLELECRLDSLLTNDRLTHRQFVDEFPAGIDWDATGDYANAVKAYEEQR